MAKYHIIETGYFMGDGGTMFGALPKRYWQKRYPCDEDNMCKMAMRCLLIEAGDRKIAVDCGCGDKQLKRLMFYRLHDLKELTSEIRKLGVHPDEITDVVFTHLHFDHCGGGTLTDEKGNIVPAFRNAVYWVSRKQWDNYRNPMLFEKDSFFPENIEPIAEAGQLTLIDNDRNICEQVSLKLFDGHTPGQIAVFFRDGEEEIVFPGDIIPSSAHLSAKCTSAYDNNAALAVEEKQRFLNEIKSREVTLIFFHDAYKSSLKQHIL